MNDDDFREENNKGEAVDVSGETGERLGRTQIPTHPGEFTGSPYSALEAYQRALEDIHAQRGTVLDEGGYASEVREKAFWAFDKALSNACLSIVYDAYPESEYTKHNRPRGDPRTTHVVASAPGSGKSTLAKAFAVALTRANEDEPYPLGSVFVVQHIATADAVFRELSALLPDGVAVFSTQHDADSAQPTNPVRFRVADLEKYPVIVVTHEFYMGIRGDYARSHTKGDLGLPRVLTFIDERANEIAVYDMDPLAVEQVVKYVQQDSYANKDLRDVVRAEGIDGWSDHMTPFLQRTTDTNGADSEFTEGFAWSLEGREVVLTWFGGYGIGANVWRDADVVIVCDDFHLPQCVIRATLQGLRGHKATEGTLADGGWNEELEYLRNGHILRWMKQMALREKSREMDENGVCGHQRLVITGDLTRLLAHRPKVFPGARIKTEYTDRGQLLDRLVALLLSSEQLNEISTNDRPPLTEPVAMLV